MPFSIFRIEKIILDLSPSSPQKKTSAIIHIIIFVLQINKQTSQMIIQKKDKAVHCYLFQIEHIFMKVVVHIVCIS